MLVFNKFELEHHRKKTGNAAPEPSVERELCWSCGCERSEHYHGGIGPCNTPPIVSGCGKCRECSFYWGRAHVRAASRRRPAVRAHCRA